jgi:hypothetical protein
MIDFSTVFDALEECEMKTCPVVHSPFVMVGRILSHPLG